MRRRVVTRRARWRTHGGRAGSVAVRVPETRSRNNGVRLPFHRSLGCLSLMVTLLCRTCFWAGDTFAPKLRVGDGVPIQRFLQDAFLDMWEAVVRAVGDLDSVLGFEVRPLSLPRSDPFYSPTSRMNGTDDE